MAEEKVNLDEMIYDISKLSEEIVNYITIIKIANWNF